MPSTIDILACEFCGKSREPRYIHLLGKDVFVGYEECSCAEFVKAKELLKEEHERKLEIAEQEKIEKRYVSACIPRRYWRLGHDKSSELAFKVLNNRSWVYIHGNNGTLKSTLAYDIAKKLIESHADVFCITSYDLMDAMRSPGKNDSETYDRVRNCSVLILDDMGKEATATAYACERLFSVIDHRSKELSPTVITSNYKLGDLAANIQVGGVGVAIASRIKEDAIVVELTGHDRRLSWL